MNNEEELEEKLKEVMEGIQAILSDDNTSMERISKQQFKRLIEEPIVILSANRLGTELEINMCTSNEAYNAAIHIITHCLHMFPKDMRNRMLIEAINLIDKKYDEGLVYMENKEDIIDEEEDGEEG